MADGYRRGDCLLEDGCIQYYLIQAAVYFFHSAVLVYYPAIAVAIHLSIADGGRADRVHIAFIGLEGDDPAVRLPVVNAFVFVNEPVVILTCDDVQQPAIGEGKTSQIVQVVLAELVGGEIVHIEPAGARFYPELAVGALEDLFYIVVGQGIGITGIVLIDLELVAVPAIEAGCGAKPHIAADIFIYTSDMVIGQSACDVEMGKSIVVGLTVRPAEGHP